MNAPHSSALDLSGAPALLFLYGVSGSGKSWIGDLIANTCGWHVYHADEDITPEMSRALENAQPFTDAMRSEYFQRLIGILAQKHQTHAHIVVTQGAYKQKYRDLLQAAFPDMALICVTAPDAIINKRIERRKTGITLASAKALRADFEMPPPGARVLINDDDHHNIIRQLNAWYATRTTADGTP